MRISTESSQGVESIAPDVLNIGCDIDIGDRPTQQDQVAVNEYIDEKKDIRERILLVADGVGGTDEGEVASKLIAHTIGKYYSVFRGDRSQKQALESAVIRAQQELTALNREDRRERLAAFAVAVVDDKGNYTIINGGDCRVYLVNGRDCSILTRDHSVAAEEYRQGRITLKEMYEGKMSTIYSALGMTGDDVSFFTTSGELLPGETLILCSDGVWGPLDTRAVSKRRHQGFYLQNTLNKRIGHNPSDIARAMINEAKRFGVEGKRDNLSVIVATREGPRPNPIARIFYRLPRLRK